MSRPKGKPQEQILEGAFLQSETILYPPTIKLDKEPQYLLERAPEREPEQIRRNMHYALWDLEPKHRGKGKALGSKAASQLMLGETVAGDTQQPGLLDIIGSDMPMTQRRAIHALYIMLHDRRYQPDDSAEYYASGGQALRSLVIVCSPIEYLEAYGLEKGASGRVSSAQRDEALEALSLLARQGRHISWPLWTGKGKGRKREVLVLDGPLLMLTKRYSNVSEQEAASEDEPPKRRLTRLMIVMHPLLTIDLERYFYLQPRDWYQRLAAAYRQASGKTLRKLPEALDLFTTWLRTLGPKIVKYDEQGLPYYCVSRYKLSEKILPPAMLEHRRQTRANEAIELAIRVAEELGLLLKWEPAMGGTGYTFWPNPEQCSRLRAAALGSGDEGE